MNTDTCRAFRFMLLASVAALPMVAIAGDVTAFENVELAPKLRVKV
jgi:hypothetical protein